jgi:hypothetical protein
VKDKPRLIVGWREVIALPDLGITELKAKIDTGARTSALHAYDIELVRRGGKKHVRFKVHPLQRDAGLVVEAEAPLVDERMVRTSGGHHELRPVIATTVELLGLTWPIEITLARRDVMGFRMLLGREALRGRALVDPGHSFVTGRRRKKKSPG